MSRYFALSFAWLAVACGGAAASPPESPASTTTPSTTAGAAPTTFAEQVTAGQALYGKNCASCHGAGGEGKNAPMVVGLSKGALPLAPPPGAKSRKVPFKTVADVAGYVVKTMPADAPGSLTADQYWSILAFDLKANGIDLGDKKLTPELAATLEIPRK